MDTYDVPNYLQFIEQLKGEIANLENEISVKENQIQDLQSRKFNYLKNEIREAQQKVSDLRNRRNYGNPLFHPSLVEEINLQTKVSELKYDQYHYQQKLQPQIDNLEKHLKPKIIACIRKRNKLLELLEKYPDQDVNFEDPNDHFEMQTKIKNPYACSLNAKDQPLTWMKNQRHDFG